MNAQPIRAALICQRTIVPAPACHACETPIADAFRDGPRVKDVRLRSSDPGQPTGWHRAIGAADVFTDGNKVVVTLKDIGKVQVLPHLTEARINIQEDPPPR